MNDDRHRIRGLMRLEIRDRGAVVGTRSAQNVVVRGGADPIDEHSFVVRLPALHRDVELARDHAEPLVDLRERGSAVNRRFAPPEPIEIGTAQHQHTSARLRGRASAAASLFARCHD